MADLDPIVALLIERRKALRLSQQKLAEAAGTWQSAISDMEAGTNMTLTTLRKICAAMGVKLFAVAPPVDGLGPRWVE